MNHESHQESLGAETSVAASTALNLGDIQANATRLRSWALIRGETITGSPFLKLGADLAASVNLPVRGAIDPHRETGICADYAGPGPAVVVEDVPFEQVREVIEELRREAAGEPAAQVEYRPTGGEFSRGAVILRLAAVP